jgi:hypothetical protein
VTDKNTTTTVVSEELRAAYLATHFDVLEPFPLTLKIGEKNRKIGKLFETANTNCAAFLTAWNPLSEPTSQAENEKFQSLLEARLRSIPSEVYIGIGRDPTGRWPGEPSLLALGVNRELAIGMGNEFRQNAIVWIGDNLIPELIMLR